MARRWVISDGSFARELTAAKVAVGGVVKPITKACVAEGGIVRQFWPPAGGTGDSRIVWTTDAITVNQTAIDPADSSAAITFNRDMGSYSYDNAPAADVYGLYLNPAVTGAGQYLIHAEQVSGAAVTGTLDTWIDLFSAASHAWSLDQSIVGNSTALLNISIAQDTGGGVPGETVTKAVTFNSEVIATTLVSWTTLQRNLVEVKETVDADCSLVFNPAGFAVGSADTSGSFQENWSTESPNAQTPADFTVTVTLVSGTSPTGTLGSPLTLDVIREWVLVATVDEDLSCELDVEVSDGSVSVTKRVTMNAQRTAEVAPPVWTTDEWNLSDVAFPQGLAELVDYTLEFPVSADATGRVDNLSGGGVQETEAWLPAGENPADYEVKIDLVSGAGALISHNLNTWYNAGSGLTFIIQYATLAGQRTRTYSASVRRIGSLPTTKVVNTITAGDDGSVPL